MMMVVIVIVIVIVAVVMNVNVINRCYQADQRKSYEKNRQDCTVDDAQC